MSRSYVGALVRLCHKVETRSGTKFLEGTLMRVVDSTSAGLTLVCYKRGWRLSVRNVQRYSVEVVEWKKEKG